MDFRITKPTHIFALLVLLFALFLLIVSPILSFFGTLPSTQDIQLTEPIILVGAVIAILIFLGTPFLWYLLVNKFSIKEMLINLKIRKQGLDMAVLWAVVTVIIMFVLAIVLGLIFSQLGFIEEELTNIQDLAGNLSLGSMIFIIIFQSASEEIFFRGFLLEKIHSLAGKEIAIISTALLFGIAHLTYGKIYPAFMTIILGLLLGYIVVRTKNLNSAIIAHVLFNVASYAFYLVYQSLDIEALIL